MGSKNLTQTLLISATLFLVLLGMIMVYSASSICAAQKFHDGAYFLKKQIAYGMLGITCMIVFMNTSYGILKKYAYPLWIVSIVLLVLVLVPAVGTRVGGAIRWLRVGPLSFQPSELAKFSLVVLLSCSLAKKDRLRIKRFSIGVLPHLIFVLPVFVLILMQPDFGTAVTVLGFLFIMLFVAGVPGIYLSAMSAVALAATAPLIVFKPYRLERLIAFLDPWKHASDTGFQLVQSFLSFAAGGLLGTGLGQGKQKLFYLPEPHTDFILSVVGEELGFIGVALVITLFVFIILCGIRTAAHAPDFFGSYLAIGISIFVGLQAVINMGVVMGLLPTKGMPLPFVSYGGTSLMINMISIGVLLNISGQCSFSSGT